MTLDQSCAEPLSLYIHWPFCLSKCPYCDFNSHVADSIDHRNWQQAYTNGLIHYQIETNGRALKSIFFGGGTPSLMPASLVASVIETASDIWTFQSNIEITLEANPTSVEVNKFKDLKEAGVNRLSLGVQSLRTDVLAFLGREHSVDQAKSAIDAAAGTFDRYSFDLIYARPGQGLEDWYRELKEALTLADQHISLYQLTIEKGTAFYRDSIEALDPDAAAEMFRETRNYLKSKGLSAYEVSNHARTGAESRHNLQYWQGGDFIGVGPGAHGRLRSRNGLGRRRLIDHRMPDRWLSAALENGTGLHQATPVSENEAMVEDLMMGLRLSEGLSRAVFEARYGLDMQEVLDSAMLTSLCAEGLIDFDDRRLLVTEKGMGVLDSILARIISDRIV